MGVNGRPEMPYDWGRVPYDYESRKPWMNLPFPVSEYERRIARLQEMLRQEGLDAIVVMGNRADNSNIRYLTNFEDFYGGEQIVVVPAEGEAGLTTNSIMHGEPMHSGIQDAWLQKVRCAAAPRTVTELPNPVTIFDHVEDFLEEAGIRRWRIGTVAPTNQLVSFLENTFPDSELVPADRLLVRMRRIKSLAEVEALRKAARLADAAMEAAMNAVKPGVTEHDLAAEANYAMFKEKAEHPSFPIALAVGKRSGFKHVAPTENVVRQGDVVYIDVGGRYMGYYSDCSRQRVCGDATDEQVRFMETQVNIVEECIKLVKPGTVIGDIAEVGIGIAREAGYEKYLYFRGHGIGAATHDSPSIAPGNKDRFEENMVFCFEPMLVKTEFGTACWEDMWWVTADGVENLNSCRIRWW